MEDYRIIAECNAIRNNLEEEEKWIFASHLVIIFNSFCRLPSFKCDFFLIQYCVYQLFIVFIFALCRRNKAAFQKSLKDQNLRIVHILNVWRMFDQHPL